MEKSQYTITDALQDSVSDTHIESFSDEKDKKWYSFLYVKGSSGSSILESFMYNHDLKPVEEERRRWAWFNYVHFWIADCFNINTWQIAATGLQLGLNWWQTWLTVWIGYTFTGVFVTLSAKMGSSYHISFPITIRASFGTFFSLWPILNRVVMATIWYSVQAWIGGECVQLMLRSIFGNDLNTKIPDHFGSANATSFQFLGFFLFWLFSLPAIWFHPHQIRHLFTVKACLVPFAAFGFLIWTLKKSNGEIALDALTSTQVHGSDFSWAFVRSILASLANFATLIINAPDFSRFAKTKHSAIVPQLISIPFFFSLTSLIGIIVTAAAFKIYEVNYWSPLDVLGRFLDHSTPGNRAGVFFISTIFAIAQLGTNISANSLSAGTDMTALFPRFINIRRGGYICAALALCICPWNLMASSNIFTTALGAYAVFLSAISGPATADYYVVRRGYLKLTHLYSRSPKSFYMYTYGCNWRALVAYICGILPNIVGFVGVVSPKIKVSIAAERIYYMNYLIGYLTSFVVYVVLCYFFPVAGCPVTNILTEKAWFDGWVDVEEFGYDRDLEHDNQEKGLENVMSVL